MFGMVISYGLNRMFLCFLVIIRFYDGVGVCMLSLRKDSVVFSRMMFVIFSVRMMIRVLCMLGRILRNRMCV